jgi:hypothetical protein
MRRTRTCNGVVLESQAPGEYETRDGFTLSYCPGAKWLLTYPGERTPDDAYPTLAAACMGVIFYRASEAADGRVLAKGERSRRG